MRSKDLQLQPLGGRQVVFIVLISVAFMLILFRFFAIQIVAHEKYRDIAQRQYERKRSVPAQRGEIIDRSGAPLAVNRESYQLDVAVHELGTQKDRLISTLLPLDRHQATYYKRKLQRRSGYVNVLNDIDQGEAEILRSSGISGLRLHAQHQRFYPLGSVGSQLLGFCDRQQRGVEGLEKSYDSVLRGRDGIQFVFADAHNIGRVRADYLSITPQHGRSIQLTLRLPLQTALEEELRAVLENHHAKAAMGVLVDVHSGDILELASLPNYDSNTRENMQADYMRNRCLSDLFDPGSIFKPITAAALLQEGVVSETEKIDCENGVYQIYDQVIHDHEKYGILDFREVLVNSSNIGIIKFAERIDNEALYRYIRAFGFGEKSGIDLPGEVRGILRLPNKWSGVSRASLAMGHEIAVTPLQMAMAYAALANGGILYQPHIVLRIEGEAEREILPVRRVIDTQTADRLKDILHEVVLEGTGRKAFLDETSIAGKTGTAQKIDSESKRYSHSSFIASFAGFFPTEAPQYAMVIMVDSPSRHSYYGGQVAAPAFRNVVERIIGLPTPVVSDQQYALHPGEKTDVVPVLTGMSREQAVAVVAHYQLRHEIQGDAEIVVRQHPAAGDWLPAGEPVILICDPDYGRNYTMPDVIGQLLRTAVFALRVQGLQVEVTGNGRISQQWPSPGTPVKPEQKVRLAAGAG
jgi:cell division protein FtsI (penicillin-binding protein 3)